MKNIIGFVVPIVPLFRSLKDRDRRFYVFVEQPLISILVTFVSLYISEELTDIPHNLNLLFWRNFIEVYLSYQLANIIRDGVNTDLGIKQNLKVLLNWYYSVLSYVLFTAADRLAKAKNEQELVFAWGIVLFSIIWPIFSQSTSTYLWTPLLFSRFPKRTLLVKLSDISISLSEILKEEKDAWNIRWVKWFRLSKKSNTRLVYYWFIKSSIGIVIGVIMTSIYYLSRWNLVGLDINKPKVFVKFLERLFF